MSREWVDACSRFFFVCCVSSLYPVFRNCVLLFPLGFWGLVLTCFLMGTSFVLYSIHFISFIIVCHLALFRAHPRLVTSGSAFVSCVI